MRISGPHNCQILTSDAIKEGNFKFANEVVEIANDTFFDKFANVTICHEGETINLSRFVVLSIDKARTDELAEWLNKNPRAAQEWGYSQDKKQAITCFDVKKYFEEYLDPEIDEIITIDIA
jgi:hypothetical protein